ncbi:hypothetical protein AGMMS50229_03560 [Campylobacterota bacterium]|nr:hypothetical protein AGMMS50229_03560 [Campylobacterota bacterium]
MKKLLMILAALIFSGCAVHTAQTIDSDQLEKNVWKLVGVSTEQAPTIEFSKDKVWGFNGVNQFNANYTINNGSFALSNMVNTLKAAIDPKLTELESNFNKVLTTASRLTLDDQTVVIESTNGSLQFEKVDFDLILSGQWELVSVGLVMVNERDRNKPFVSFNGGTITGHSGINHIRATYTLDGKNIQISPLIGTKMAGRESAMELEKQFLSALQSATTITAANATSLKINSANAGLTFKRK